MAQNWSHPRPGNWITVITEQSIWTHFDGSMTKLLLTFCDFFDTSKILYSLVKRLVFKIWKKNVKYERWVLQWVCLWVIELCQTVSGNRNRDILAKKSPALLHILLRLLLPRCISNAIEFFGVVLRRYTRAGSARALAISISLKCQLYVTRVEHLEDGHIWPPKQLCAFLFMRNPNNNFNCQITAFYSD